MAFKEQFMLLRKKSAQPDGSGSPCGDIIRHHSGTVWLVMAGPEAEVGCVRMNQSFTDLEELCRAFDIDPLNSEKWGLDDGIGNRFRLSYVSGA
jgi:hypothetical protein